MHMTTLLIITVSNECTVHYVNDNPIKVKKRRGEVRGGEKEFFFFLEYIFYDISSPSRSDSAVN